jgi:hypothetical protein
MSERPISPRLDWSNSGASRWDGERSGRVSRIISFALLMIEAIRLSQTFNEKRVVTAFLLSTSYKCATE